ncbi:MAG: hypothetical protein ACI9W6_003211, partial [Motiliproteus sp.]
NAQGLLRLTAGCLARVTTEDATEQALGPGSKVGNTQQGTLLS